MSGVDVQTVPAVTVGVPDADQTRGHQVLDALRGNLPELFGLGRAPAQDRQQAHCSVEELGSDRVPAHAVDTTTVDTRVPNGVERGPRRVDFAQRRR
jgi:hypothetical protein